MQIVSIYILVMLLSKVIVSALIIHMRAAIALASAADNINTKRGIVEELLSMERAADLC
jgi:hypothetical protein